MARPYETISFLSDYGHDDEFVGVVHSVVRSIAPQTTVVDITHGVAPHDVRAGALALVRACQYMVPGVVLAVVDPGVGTDRRGIAVEVGEGESVLVGPDNGLLAPAVAMTGGAGRCISLTNDKYHLESAGATFAGRDILGPVAAHLCNGVDMAEFGEPIDPVSLLPGVVPLSQTDEETGAIRAEVLWVDRYGNAQLNVGPEDLAAWDERISVKWSDQTRTAKRTNNYADLGHGQLGLVTDSYGLLALAFDRRPAADELHLRPGDGVMLSEATA